jgi:hypothetical protein
MSCLLLFEGGDALTDQGAGDGRSGCAQPTSDTIDGID